MLALIFAAAVATSDAGSQPAGSTQAPPPAASVKPDAHDPNRIVCTREDIPNTRMTRKVCRTQAELDAEQEQKERFFHNLNEQSGQMPQQQNAMSPR